MSLSLYLHKMAAPSHAATVAPEVAMVNNEAREQAAGTIGNIALGGLGLGGAAAGLIALKNWLARPKPPSAAVGLHPSEIDLPYPQFVGSDVTPGEAKGIRKRKDAIERAKEAGESPGQRMLRENHERIMRKLLPPATLAKHAPECVEKEAEAAKEAPGVFSGDWLAGKGTMHATSMPWFLPAAALAGIGGVAGGAGLVNWLAERRRKAEQKAEVDDAKAEFEEAMLGQYVPARTHRLLGAKEAQAPASLDGLFELCREAGFARPMLKRSNDLLGTATGAYGTLAALLGLGTGYGMYQYLDSRSKSKQLEQALKDRAAVRATMNPPELFIHPLAVKKKKPLREEADAAVSATV